MLDVQKIRYTSVGTLFQKQNTFKLISAQAHLMIDEFTSILTLRLRGTKRMGEGDNV